MLEIPEAFVLAKQLNETVSGKRITGVVADSSPHKMAFYYQDPQDYPDLLTGKKIIQAAAYGGLAEIRAGKEIILFGDGIRLNYHEPGAKHPPKHQVLLEFADGSALSAKVMMYGGIWCFREGEFDNFYYVVAKEKPSPLTDEFDRNYFVGLIAAPEVQNLSVKAFLATEQRIPGLGNGVLQDILWRIKVHPKRKIKSLTATERDNMFSAVKNTLKEMAGKGGRDTEMDLFGEKGGYQTAMSKNHLGQPCPVCGVGIIKQAYMGGSIYFCPGCQIE
jgi:formamidopyrimidine-DNA glycosylase